MKWLSPQRPNAYDEFVSITTNGQMFISKPIRQRLGISVDSEEYLAARIGVDEDTNSLLIYVVERDKRDLGLFRVTDTHGVGFNGTRFVGMRPGRYKFTYLPDDAGISIDLGSRYEFRASSLPDVR